MLKAVQGYLSAFIQGLGRFTSKSIVKNLIVITLCIAFFFVQVFFPYSYYASAQRTQNSPFQVGVHYVYEQDQLDQIYGQVSEIKNLGIKLVRVTMECNPTEPIGSSDLTNLKTDRLYSATDQLGVDVALVIKNHDETGKINYYLERWGRHLDYVQVLNEPELSSSWDVGALFTDDEIITNFQRVYSTVEAHPLSAKLYTNFGAGYILRSNVPIELSKNLDFVGLDIYMDSFLVLSPHFINNLHGITNKDVVITEFGMSTSNSLAQSAFIIKGLTLFRSMGLKGCWIAYWNSQADYYGIRGRPAEHAVGDWIAQNAN
jgi:hypothetical protein